MSPYLPTIDNRRARSITILAVACVALASFLLAAAGGEARSLKPTVNPRLLLGVTGSKDRFETQTGQDSAVAHAFLGWDQGRTWGAPFAAFFPTLAPIPMIHLGTKGANPSVEAITPGRIASGAGDAYLIALNHAIAVWGKAMYVRPMGEMNNANSFYGAYNASGSARDAEHSTTSYKKAFARIYLILHGGSVESVNAKLKALGMPAVKAEELLATPFPTLRIVWSPLASDNPRVPGNAAEQYYPGASFVDVEGGDIYAEQLGDTAPWGGLESLYQKAMARGKPFSIPEWGLDSVDDAAFVRHMCSFLKTHSPTETAIFYESRPGSSYDLEPKPSSRAAYRECVIPLAGKTFPAWAAVNAPGGGAKVVGLSLTPDPESGPSPLSVDFSIGAKLSVPISHWRLLFGDGSDADGDGPPPTSLKHTYKGAGVYHAVLFVFRAPPFSIEDTPYFAAADVSVGTAPEALLTLTPTPKQGPLPLSVSFFTKADLPARVTGWTMIFGDGLSRREPGPPPRFSGHTFSAAGTYCVLLILDTAGGKRYASVTEVVAGAGGDGSTGTPCAPGAPPTGTAKGDVLVNGKPFDGGKVPFGAKVDVSDGRLVLKTATGQMSFFGEGGLPAKLKLVQGTDNGKPVVVLILDGGDFSSCRKRKTSSAVLIPPKKKPIRQLWGSGNGSFRTKGRFAAATVRGTIWLTVDRCDGTLIKVKKGVVEVLDVKTKKLHRIKAGRSYLATG